MKKQQLKEALKSEIRKVLKENQNELISKDVKDYLLNLYDIQASEDNDEGDEVIEVFEKEEYGSEAYEDYEMFEKAYNEIKKMGGKIKINDFNPEMEFSLEGDDIKLKYIASYLDESLTEMARIAKTIKISDLEKAKAVIDKVKDTKKKWIADMIQKVIDAGDEGIAQVALAKALGKVDEFGDGRQQAINPEVRSLLGGDVFTFGAAKVADKPEATDITTDNEDEIITSVPDETEDEEEIDITNDDVEDSEDEDETEADEFLKPDEEETEDDEEVAKKATPNKRIGSKADQLDAVINDMKKLAADYKKAKTDGDKDKEKEIADKLKEKTKLKKELEKDINISLGDEDEDEL